MDVAIGYLIAWSWRKARHAAGRADGAVAEALDAGVDRLRDLVVGKLAGEKALAKLADEAGTDLDTPQVGERTKRMAVDALEVAAEEDPEFAAQLQEHLERLAAARAASGSTGEYRIAVGGDVHIEAKSGGVAAQVIQGSVTTGSPLSPGSGKA